MTREPEYSSGRSAVARSAAQASPRRLRLLYFGAASLWGFLSGVGGLLAAPDGPQLLVLVPAAGIAIAGAGIIAGAYQEAKRRRR